jgi:anti-anti-sigma factor
VALEITERELEGVYVLVLLGRLVLGEESGRFRSTVETLLSNGATRIVVSLYDVNSIGTSGLCSLIDALQGSKARGGLLKLASPSSRFMQVLHSSDLQGIFEIFPTEAAAIQSFWSNCPIHAPDQGPPPRRKRSKRSAGRT